MNRFGAAGAALLAVLAVPGKGVERERARIEALAPLPGGSHCVAYGVDDAGNVAGASDTTSGQYHAVLWAPARGDLRARDLGVLPGGTESFARAVSRGRIVGESTTRLASGHLYNHAFLWQHGKMTDLGVLPGASATVARTVTPRGRIAGASDTPEGLMAAVEWKSEQLGRLGTGDAAYSFAYGANDHAATVGRIAAGSLEDGTVKYAPVLFRGSTVHPLRTFSESRFACAYAVNERGQAVGESETGLTDDAGFRVRRAVLWSGDQAVDLGALFGGAVSCAYAISSNGRNVAGYSETASGVPHAVLWSGGRLRDLNGLLPGSSGWVLATARGVNRQGVVVGQGSFGGKSRAFRLRILP